MRISARWALVACVVALGVEPCAAQQRAAPPDETTEVVGRAARYASEFINRFASMVAEEAYVQERVPRSGIPRKRTLTSDVLFVRPTGNEEWFVFRDVRFVDGKEVGTSGQRLVELLASGASDLVLARALLQEAARYGLPQWPTFNQPLLVMGFLQDTYRARFQFTLDRGASRNTGGEIVLRFDERVRPTILRFSGGDLPAAGRIWIDAASGRITRTQMSMTNNQLSTEFGRDEVLGFDVPVEMRESYYAPGAGYTLRGRATYSKFRTFQVRTNDPALILP